MIKTIKELFVAILEFSKTQLLCPQERKEFSKESYLALLPLFSNINSYIQTFLGVFSSSMMALNAAFIVVILTDSHSDIKYKASFIIAVCIFTATLLLYILSFVFIFAIKAFLINKSRKNDINFESISFFMETSLTFYGIIISISSISFFVCFIILLSNMI